MARVSPLVVLPPVIFAALAGLFLGGMMREDPDALPTVFGGKPAPAFALDALPGRQEFTREMLDETGAKLVNFWASWCPPCRLEHPQLMQLEAEGLPVYGVNLKDDDDKAVRFLDDLGDPYRAVGADPRGRNMIDWGVTAPPETFVIDGDGKVILRFAGPITAEILEKRIRPAIEEASAE